MNKNYSVNILNLLFYGVSTDEQSGTVISTFKIDDNLNLSKINSTIISNHNYDINKMEFKQDKIAGSIRIKYKYYNCEKSIYLNIDDNIDRIIFIKDNTEETNTGENKINNVIYLTEVDKDLLKNKYIILVDTMHAYASYVYVTDKIYNVADLSDIIGIEEAAIYKSTDYEINVTSKRISNYEVNAKQQSLKEFAETKLNQPSENDITKEETKTTN